MAKKAQASKAASTRSGKSRAGKANGARPRTRGMGGGGHRLAEAFGAVERLPVLAISRERLRRMASKPGASDSEIVETVESDVALTIAVLRAASQRNGRPGRLTTVQDAVETLTPAGVEDAAEQLETYDFFEPAGEWRGELERFRRHSAAVKHAAGRIAEVTRLPSWDELTLAALLHDIGRVVLVRLYPGYLSLVDDRTQLPEERIKVERRELGIDHALVGGVLARRWGLPSTVAAAIERHHAEDGEGAAAAVALADLIAHHGHGEAVSARRVSELSARCGLPEDRTWALLYEFPYTQVRRRRRSEPCPLSGRELDALRGLAEGKVYKEIAVDLGLSVSTVRTHLHNVYRKIGAVDRAQAVLIARERDWI